MRSLRYYTEALKKNPKYMVFGIIFLILSVYAISLNWHYISMLFAQESQAKKTLAPLRDRLATALLKRDELISTFALTYARSRNFVIVGDKSVTDLGVGLENDLRSIADESGFEFDRLGQCRFNRISDTLDIAEIQVSAKAQWSDILWFMSDIEQSKPHFAWTNFNLTVDYRAGLINLTGTLRAIVVKDPQFIEILSTLPLPEHNLIDTYTEPAEEDPEDETANESDSEMETTLENQTDSSMTPKEILPPAKTRIDDENMDEAEDLDFDFEGNEDGLTVKANTKKEHHEV